MCATVGVAIPGTISPVTGLVKNANATRLIGHPLDKDLGAALNREVRVANDANCFTLSEATDGAAKGRDIVFGIIAGTGIGGGVCVGGRVLAGAHAIAGEWGHIPCLPHAATRSPWPQPAIADGPAASRPGAADRRSWPSSSGARGRKRIATEIAAEAASGGEEAKQVFAAYLDRFARAIAGVVNILDPDAIVIGGGLSKIDTLYAELPARVEHYAFSPQGPSLNRPEPPRRQQRRARRGVAVAGRKVHGA